MIVKNFKPFKYFFIFEIRKILKPSPYEKEKKIDARWL